MRSLTRVPATPWRAAVPLALLLTAVGLSGCDRDGQASATKTAEIAAVERRDLEVKAEASGVLEAVRSVEVKSKASGEIQNLLVDTGDQVRRGQLLAAIDPRDVRNAFSQAEADHELASARVQTATTQLHRAGELFKAGLITRQDLETAQLEEVNSRAQLVKAQTNLTLARQKLGDVTITAPMDGTVTAKTVESGQVIASASGNVSGGTTLLTLSDLARMQVRALVDETDIGRIREGLPARVTVEAYPNREFRGQVEKVEPQAVVEQNVTMFPVLVRLDNPERLLRPGMNADVEIDVARREDVVVVPNSAVVALRDAATAAAVLGLDGDAVRASLRRRRAGRGPGGWSGRGTASAGSDRTEAGGPAGEQGAALPTGGPGEAGERRERSSAAGDPAGRAGTAGNSTVGSGAAGNQPRRLGAMGDPTASSAGGPGSRGGEGWRRREGSGSGGSWQGGRRWREGQGAGGSGMTGGDGSGGPGAGSREGGWSGGGGAEGGGGRWSGSDGGPWSGGGGGGRWGGGSGEGGMGGNRPALVFVSTPKGPEPRRVVLGLSDWDDSEVVSGLQPGEQVYLISVARMQQQQEQAASRMRERAGGGFLGGGGGGSAGAGGGGNRGGGGRRGGS